MARTKEEQQEIEGIKTLLQEQEREGKRKQSEIDELNKQLKKLERGGGSDQQLPTIDPEAAEKRLAANRKRRPDNYEAKTEDGKIIGRSVRPGGLDGLARGRSRGEFIEGDDHGRQVRRQGAAPEKVTITRIHGNTGERTVVAVYDHGERAA